MSYSKLDSNLILRSFMVFAKTVLTGFSGPPCNIKHKEIGKKIEIKQKKTIPFPYWIHLN